MIKLHFRLLFGISALAFGAAASAQDLLVSSSGTHSIKRFNSITGAFVGDFVASGSGGLNNPQGIAWGPDGNLYVSSVASGRVLRYNGQTGAFIDAFTQGPAMFFPADMSFHDGSLYVSDFRQLGRVNRYDANTGAFQGQFTNDTFGGPDGIVWDSGGNMYVSAFGPGTVRKYNSAGVFQGTFASGGGLAGSLDLRWGSDGNLYVNSFQTGHVKRFDGTTGVFIDDFISGLGGTQGQEIGPDGALYVGSWTGNFINKYDEVTGVFIGQISGGGLSAPNNFVFMPVPEPVSMVALAVGLAGVAVRRRRRS